MEQAVSDLQENRRLQQELARRLESLQQEEELLLSILNLAEHSTLVPEQAQSLDTPLESSEDPVPPTQLHPLLTTMADHTSSPQKQNSAPGPGRRPRLGDLLLDLLRGHKEPRLAKELREELINKYPDRTPTAQVVRNTLEGLVAKSLIERSKQNRSVMYTLIATEEGGGATASADFEDRTEGH
jgi:hypothetical protein